MAPMRVVQLLRTPWSPYSAMFAADGARIAVGGGTWYGAGGVLLARLGADEVELCPTKTFADFKARGAPTVSGICFSADDRHLIASTWSSSHHHGPALLCEVSGLRLRPVGMLVHAFSDPLGDPCPTGVFLTDEHIIVRNDTSMPADVFAVWPHPAHMQIAGMLDHTRTHSGIVVIRGRMITGGGGSLTLGGWRCDIGRYERGKAADGLISAPLTGDGPLEIIPVPSCRRITAIATRPDDDGFLTGGLDGELHRWTWADGWRCSLLLRQGGVPPAPPEGLTWATYTQHSVVAICALADGERWVSVTAGGELRLWRRDETIGAWFLPEQGSPRALAAHPSEPLVAVGIKQQHNHSGPESTVIIIDLGGS